ncbi:phage tail protein [Sphingomonas glacialis]|uniref:phage tail protein n=1 Tax=Sphingomonas glacialis TaxID=658225 RepID=UPI001F4FDC76|nr:phage tail protein [Sphingomonas glacialis]
MAALESVRCQLTLSHYNPAREYQIGLQTARRPGAGRREDQVELPAAIYAGTAKTLAAAILARGAAGRERRTVTLGWDALDVVPGACVTIAGVAGVWRVTAWLLEKMMLSLECVRLAGGALPLAASPGRVLAAPDVATGQDADHGVRERAVRRRPAVRAARDDRRRGDAAGLAPLRRCSTASTAARAGARSARPRRRGRSGGSQACRGPHRARSSIMRTRSTSISLTPR